MKGFIHFHSNYSHDGALSLEQIKALALKHNINFICTSEHDEDINDYKKYITHCKKLSDSIFQFIPGLETVLESSHFIIINADKKFSSLKDIKNNQIFILSHPKSHRIPSFVTERLDGVEIWNLNDDSRFTPNKKKLKIFRKLKKRSPKIKAFTAMDFHHSYHFKPTYIITESNRVISDLKSGNFFTFDKRVKISASGKMDFKPSFYFFNLLHHFLKTIAGTNKVLKIKIPYKLRKIFYQFY